MRTGIGQDSHRFLSEGTEGCVLAGVRFEGVPALSANSDGDVVLHALTNAISGITCQNVLGVRADALCRAGITDSAAYVREALKDLAALGMRLTHLSFSIECARPKITPAMPAMRANLAALTGVGENAVGITATTGEGLTDFGRGLGIQVFCVATAEKDQ
ncbi:MAG: 2-C-methyl-D-erythritol 2,4-cyclodiphosphate synthase [Lachnospiraceae bacterium]|nr:2-C-methyl-D-erythritol 2,4-cyclodiphosphate synthase [Lachnospiraceae bacterium]